MLVIDGIGYLSVYQVWLKRFLNLKCVHDMNTLSEGQMYLLFFIFQLFIRLPPATQLRNLITLLNAVSPHVQLTRLI